MIPEVTGGKREGGQMTGMRERPTQEISSEQSDLSSN